MRNVPILAELENWLRTHLPDAANSLNPPVADDAWVAIEAESGHKLPGGFISLYRWHDGQPRRCPTGIFYGMRFLPIREVLEEWRANDSPAWIPFASDDGGNFLAIDLEPVPGGDRGQVTNRGADELRHYTIAPDVLDFVKWMLAELAAGNHRIVDEGGGFSFNTLRPPTQHFLDSAKVIFGKAAPRPAKPAASGPPRDSTIGTFFFIRDELARHAPAGWKSLSVDATISGEKDQRAVSLTHQGLVEGKPAALEIPAPQALAAAFIELKDRTREERWEWKRMKLKFSAATPDKFEADAS
jgi:cell wall assembly regulator SMI1